jgi:hypothetical protein
MKKSMKMTWSQVEQGFQKSPSPDEGTKRFWMDWYRLSWGHLEQAGLTSILSSLDITRVKLRAVILVWLAHDSLAYQTHIHDQQIYDEELEWASLLRPFDVEHDGLVMLGLTTNVSLDLENVTKECCPDLSYCDEDDLYFQAEDWEKFIHILVYGIASRERRLVVEAICRGFGGITELSLSMYMAAIACLDDAKWEILDEIEELDSDLANAKITERIQIEETRRFLQRKLENEDSLLSHIRENLWNKSEMDDDYQSRLLWFATDCPILINPQP